MADYLASAGLPVPDAAVILEVLAAEKAAQARVVNVPADDAAWPADLVEALCRRVAHNLAVRPLALGFKVELSDTTGVSNTVGGTDAEVRRLELPMRKRPVA
ncbi:hypothetical protein KDN32_17740 [Nocardioides sp. J2M5]|uniref:hypothetical protein n=1 Tax=Nocardioides palaemonis TaxID=2829810 RepID=UPI001BAB2B5A|nr:hypothetical protein [Nocardioides palaemonis]MBS2939585.1 hypothetical protein [Nocardioides palaemonis]